MWMFSGKLTVEQVLKSFLGRNNSLTLPVFGFCDSLPQDLEESLELTALISWVLGLYAFRYARRFCQNFCLFLSCHYGFTNYFNILILFSNIQGGVPTF